MVGYWRGGGGCRLRGQRDGFRGFNGFSPVLTGQHSEEGHRSADSGEEGAAGGPEGQERWYCSPFMTVAAS